ncbi:MAG: hypothetical protein O9346_04290 [Leptospiraceae bacterium]|nr:hypothetical protein [Leptospiraceae bacterium]MCZ8345615.1 hypothetical protein [Leptospiraceae bacterium]PJE01985.1 MAG: hypothetical protein CK427_09290 [Leptospira sp.]
MGINFLFFILGISFCQPILAQTLYFPGKMEASLRNKIDVCGSKPIAKFEFKESDFYQESLRQTLSKISQRSKLEGKTRAASLLCIIKMNLNTQEKKMVSAALQDLFDIEIQLYQSYLKWMQAGLGLDAKNLESYFQSRYDLMILIQTKSITILNLDKSPNQADIEEDFSNLYQSVHRSNFDAVYSLDPSVRERYFQVKEGRKQ